MQILTQCAIFDLPSFLKKKKKHVYNRRYNLLPEITTNQKKQIEKMTL